MKNVTEKQINEWRKAYRKSKQALPVEVGFLLVMCATVWIAGRFWTVPSVFAVIVIGVPAFSVIGDIVNLVFLGRKLHQVGKDVETRFKPEG